MEKKLLLYSIMPLDTTHIEEICADIKNQVESGIASCALFKMSLVPEGNPPKDKAKALGDKYAIFKKKLDSMGIPNGILVQSSLGHGWTLAEKFPFQNYVGIKTGLVEENICCPEDDGFCEHFKNAMKTLASCKPDMIMVDDDFRLIYRAEKGCACPLHMKKFNSIAKTDFSREELSSLLRKSDGNSREYSEIFVRTQKESLIKAAKAMREGIDSVDKTIPGSFCCCGHNAEFAYVIAKELAGEGNPTIVRINNGSYLASSGRFFSNVFQRAACQIERLKDKVDYILAETDTFPQNRYSTSAAVLHAHFTGTILEGAKGAKQWITRLSAFEPESGKAYRKVLSKYRMFYEVLSELTPDLKYLGCRIPLTQREIYDYTKLDDYGYGFDETDNWSKNILERLGFPLYFSSENGGAVFMEGDADKKFTDQEILEFFKGPVFLASDTAKRLCDRGFLKYIGCSVSEWNGINIKSELLLTDNSKCNSQPKIKQLTLEDEKAYAHSMTCTTSDAVNYSMLFPGISVFENELGGITVVFSGTPDCDMSFSEPFSYLNESRKKQFAELLKKASCLPVYYPGDGEIYLKCAEMKDKGLFCAAFSLGLDTLENFTLVSEKDVQKVYTLTPDGERKEIPFTADENTITIDIEVKTLDPVILFIY